MDSLRIDILNPKAKKLLQDLEALDLIAIRKTSGNGFGEVLKRLRKKAATAPAFDEITKEVEAVRTKRYGQQK